MSLPERARAQVRDHIEHWEDAMVAYQTSIDVRANRDELKKSFVIQELNVDLDRLNARVPAQELLSRYAQDYVYKFMENSGPNCIYSAIASIFEGFEPPRYMDIPEFLQDMTDYIQPIDKPDQWGDIVRFVIPGDIHAFTFLGRDAKDPGVQIVLTKNGYSPSHLTVMNYDEVYQLYAEYGIQAVEYYRPVKIAKPHPTLRPEGAMKGINPLPRAYLRAVPLAKRPVLEL
jgi:hypothetical protein